MTEVAVCRSIVRAVAALLRNESGGGHGLVGMVLTGQEGSGVRLKKGSDNQHAVGGLCHGRCWKQSPTCQQKCLPRRHSSQGWMLLCGCEEEVSVTMAAAMLSRWRLQEHVLEGAMRAGRGRKRHNNQLRLESEMEEMMERTQGRGRVYGGVCGKLNNNKNTQKTIWP